jgi:hypothetical protein
METHPARPSNPDCARAARYCVRLPRLKTCAARRSPPTRDRPRLPARSNRRGSNRRGAVVQQFDAALFQDSRHHAVIAIAAVIGGPKAAIMVAQNRVGRRGRAQPAKCANIFGAWVLLAVRDEIAGDAHDVRPFGEPQRNRMFKLPKPAPRSKHAGPKDAAAGSVRCAAGV